MTIVHSSTVFSIAEHGYMTIFVISLVLLLCLSEINLVLCHSRYVIFIFRGVDSYDCLTLLVVWLSDSRLAVCTLQFELCSSRFALCCLRFAVCASWFMPCSSGFMVHSSRWTLHYYYYYYCSFNVRYFRAYAGQTFSPWCHISTSLGSLPSLA